MPYDLLFEVAFKKETEAQDKQGLKRVEVDSWTKRMKRLKAHVGQFWGDTGIPTFASCTMVFAICMVQSWLEHEQIQAGFEYVKFDDVVADSTSSIVSCG